MGNTGKGGERSSGLVTMTVASLLGGAMAAVITLLLLLLCSVAISSGIIGQSLELQVIIAACVIGSFCGGRLTRRRWGCRQLIAGLSAGAVFFLILLTISLIGYETVDIGGAGLGVMAGCLCGGAIAGLLGGKGTKKKRRTY